MPQPLSGLAGFVREAPFATPEERHGGTADPRHALTGEQTQPFPWDNFPGEPHGPYGVENEMLGVDIASWVEPADILADDPTGDQTPVRGHAAPWPKGLNSEPRNRDAVAAKLEESRLIHGTGMGGSREMLYLPTADPVQDDWQLIDYTDPGTLNPDLAALPRQLQTGVSGWGSRDRTHSMARQNEYGYDSAHVRRRFARGSIPGNYMWLEPGSRPLVKSIPGTAIVPTGADSPFAGQDGSQAYNVQGGVLQVLPASYVAPPDPNVAPAYVGDEAGVGVDLY